MLKVVCLCISSLRAPDERIKKVFPRHCEPAMNESKRCSPVIASLRSNPGTPILFRIASQARNDDTTIPVNCALCENPLRLCGKK